MKFVESDIIGFLISKSGILFLQMCLSDEKCGLTNFYGVIPILPVGFNVQVYKFTYSRT